MLRKLRVPPDTTAADVRQEIAAAWVRRSAAGYHGARLFVRVWGDVKDVLGRSWRQWYSSRPVTPDTPEVATASPVAPAGPDLGAVLDVRDAVAKLTEKQQYVVRRMAFEGAHRDEVAAETGISPHGVTVLYCRAKAKLKELLEDYA